MAEGPIDPPSVSPKPESYEKVIANWTRILGWSTIALFLATGGSAYFLYKTDQTISTQVENAKLQTRAYVTVARTSTDANFDKPTDAGISSFDVKVAWRNFGYTPAFDFDWFADIGWYPNGVEPDFSKPVSNDPAGTPGYLGGQLETTATKTIHRPDLLKAAAGNGRIFVWGVATYRDFAGADRRSTFCYIAELPIKRGDEPKIHGYKKDCNKSS
jgi:hypothetical protein